MSSYFFDHFTIFLQLFVVTIGYFLLNHILYRFLNSPLFMADFTLHFDFFHGREKYKSLFYIGFCEIFRKYLLKFYKIITCCIILLDTW